MTQIHSPETVNSNTKFVAAEIQRILAGKLFDTYQLQFLPSQTIIVSKNTGIILNVESTNPNDLDPSQMSSGNTIDLRHLTILPGFVDTHVHCKCLFCVFLHSYGETSWDDQTTKESLVERTVRATVHARKTLLSGFTTVRDLGTEGAEDADISLRKCLSGPNPLIPGPRYFCANRAIVCTGSYGPKSSLHMNREGLEGVTGAEVADGVDECIRATRRQIGAGADWIKIYADYRFRSRMNGLSPRFAGMPLPTFNELELGGVKVAAHASNTNTIVKLLELGIDTIEHGSTLTPHPDSLMRLLSTTPNTIWVPTLAAWQSVIKMFQRALAIGMDNIACGGDTGAFPHGENSLEMKLMVRLGAEWKKVLKWATLGGWECIRPMGWEVVNATDGSHDMPLGDNDHRFGCIKPGWAADLVGVEGDFEKDFEGTVDNVQFVMKAGRIYKLDEKIV
ncbi:hypothetical protein C8R41DRAFT_904808 [Lentinula lateritia]|uniref:Amidohydrolase-related domain-containing protein n=1 Tax=Lentinula lateritia TaxID=40482 RepID=A0ABQ8V768_9AGAR|nr:hypothetical protein C8R41DRAFT_904808 [Lentinula lateritia]